MPTRARMLLAAATCACALAVASGHGLANESSPPIQSNDLESLRAEMELQRKALEDQERALEAQRRRLEALESQINAAGGATAQPAVYRATPDDGAPKDQTQDRRYVQSQSQGTPPVGEAPPEEEKRRRAAVPAGPEEVGVLTDKGTLIIEPAVQFSHASTNRFLFQGFELAEVVLIGGIEASDADRNAIIPSVTARYGITNRLEVEVEVPWVYRDDEVTNTIVAVDPSVSRTTSASGSDLGDVEFGVHYQINSGRGGWPFFVGNLSVKSDTGTDPFDVDRDADGIATELASGTGFWGIEPSLSIIYPTDPAVFFMNVGYLWNIERDVDTVISDAVVRDVDPGDWIRGSIGMGFSINEKSSFSIGYSHDYIGKTRSKIDGRTRKSETLQSGSLFFGLSHRLTDNIAIHGTVEGGVTDDATDVVFTLRLPISFSLF